MKNIKNRMIKIVAIATLVLLFYKCTNKKEQPKEIVTIGVVASLSGDATPYGEAAKRAVMIASDKFNKTSTLEIKVVFEDGKCNATDARLVAEKLINSDKVPVILGGSCSSETLSIAPLANSTKTLLIAAMTTAPEIADAGDFVFRTIPSDASTGISVAKKIQEDANRIAIISENTDFAQGLRRVMTEYWKEQNTVEILVDEVFDTEDTDFTPQILKLKNENPSAIFINPQTGKSASRLVKQLREEGITAQIYAYFLTGDDFVKSGSFTENIIVFGYRQLVDTESASEYIQAYTERYGATPQYGEYSASTYDTFNIIAQAIQEVGTNPEDLRDYLYTMEPYDGIYAKSISFDSKGEISDQNAFGLLGFQIRNGELIKL